VDSGERFGIEYAVKWSMNEHETVGGMKTTLLAALARRREKRTQSAAKPGRGEDDRKPVERETDLRQTAHN